MDKLKVKVPLPLYNKLVEANIDSLPTILIKCELELRQLTKLSASEVNYLKREAAKLILKTTFKPANEIPECARLTTSCDTLDLAIRGGFPVNGINEIVGSSGVGKTQLCLQLSLTAQLPVELGGLNKGCVYICTEDVFPSKRLHQLAKLFPLNFPQLDVIKFEENIFIEHISDYKQLEKCLEIRLRNLLTVKKIGLIVIDSIAGLFRSENLDVNYCIRSQTFQSIALQLDELSQTYGICILCVNQVSDNPETGNVEPALGLAWSNLVTSRFSISRLYDNLRLFETVFAPDLPNSRAKFVIGDVGLVGVQ